MVSVIIPTYNRASTIEGSIISVINQTYQDLEVIIVDDASDDDTKGIVRKIQDNRIRYIKNPKNVGVASARNIGIKNANGEYIAFNDSDDIWLPNKLEKQMMVMEKNPDCMLVYCAFKRTYLEGNTVRSPALSEKKEELQGNIFFPLLQRNTISTQTMLFRKESFEKIGFFKEELRALDDYEIALRVAYKNKILYVDEVLVNVFLSKNSISLLDDNYLKHFEAYIQILKTYWNKIDDNKRLTTLLLSSLNCMQRMSLQELNIYGKLISPYFIENEELLEFFLNTIKNQRRYRYKDMIMTRLYNLSNKSFEKYFRRNNIFQVAIYGNGYLGHSLCKKIELLGIKILYIIDRNVVDAEYPIISLKKVADMPYVDAIIISIFDETGEVKIELEKNTDIKVIHIDELLENI